MMLSVVPMYASAADPIALTEANVTVWPTASGEIYFGQKISDGITLSGGEVQYDGAVVAGHFEFNDVNFMPTSSGNKTTSIKFTPDNASEFVGFSIETCYDVTYTVKKTTLVYVDENDTVPVATEVEPGAKLSTSKLSGAKVKNPYCDDEPKALAGVWKWSKGSTVVTESGYYEAKMTVVGYEILKQMVYVKVKENTVNTTIAEAPSVGELTYDANKTWADVTLTGGKAVEEGTETEVTGTFAITKVNGSSVLSNKVITDGDTVEITFTPSDTDKYLTSTITITATVNPAPIKFVDENGNDIVPEITVPYGTKFNDISRLLKPYVKGPEYVYFVMGDLSSQLCANGTYTVTATAPSDGAHYEDTELTFKIVVEPKVINPKAYSSTEGYYVYDNSGVYNVEGTFDFYIDGELYKSGVKYLEKVAYIPETSGTHEIKFVYKPVENDNFAIENEMTATVTVNLVHKLTLSDNTLSKPGDYRYGTAIELVANVAAENFAGWKITDAKGNEVDLGVDLTATKITITMPDYDIHVEALEKNATSGGSGGLGDIDFGDLSEGDSEWAIINIIRNIIAMFKSFLQQLIETFQSIGD